MIHTDSGWPWKVAHSHACTHAHTPNLSLDALTQFVHPERPVIHFFPFTASFSLDLQSCTKISNSEFDVLLFLGIILSCLMRHHKTALQGSSLCPHVWIQWLIYLHSWAPDKLICVRRPCFLSLHQLHWKFNHFVLCLCRLMSRLITSELPPVPWKRVASQLSQSAPVLQWPLEECK